ncbi:trp operon repressor [Enterovibrio sp. ZSDZ35]|uniref:Trp operon repressor homolog n=2 Tax=Enterovibrio TaxID=188143 RepID=A0A1T4TS27_9GAMM|nr:MULTISPECIES: trp operon repressor [Enterovibrio]MDD1784095.1 trp operon repressor [Enterovibrio sp. ZSDZ35]PKF51872.1 trp operon repressor [Enterovibrio nigricans]SKA43255.1 Trp operon repressor [Enterovibrio nigricans DSM 22720]
MQNSPEYSDWQDVLDLIHKAIDSGREAELLKMLLTQDERTALIARVNIVNELLKGEVSQRQLSQMLGVGIATITRGSNEIKQLDDDQKAWLMKLLEK